MKEVVTAKQEQEEEVLLQEEDVTSHETEVTSQEAEVTSQEEEVTSQEQEMMSNDGYTLVTNQDEINQAVGEGVEMIVTSSGDIITKAQYDALHALNSHPVTSHEQHIEQHHVMEQHIQQQQIEEQQIEEQHMEQHTVQMSQVEITHKTLARWGKCYFLQVIPKRVSPSQFRLLLAVFWLLKYTQK